MSKIKGESRLSFFEATSIIVGHGVGAGILSVPYLAAHNSLREILWIITLGYLINIVLHLIIAELSYNNNGAQFVSCFDAELFSGRIKKILTWLTFALLGVSVIVNVSAFLTGAAAVFRSWFGLPDVWGMLLFYVIGAGVVFIGMKLVGICEKIAVGSMLAVIGILFVATLRSDISPLPSGWHGWNNVLAMYGMVSFSLSAVMSTPQVVKGLEGDPKRIRGSITLGLAINAGMILLITLMTLLGAGQNISETARWSISRRISRLGERGRLRVHSARTGDIFLGKHAEPARHRRRADRLAASLPCLLLAFFGLSSFVGFTRFASVIQVVTGLGILVAYNLSRRRVGGSALIGVFGSLPFQILVGLSTLLATIGAVLPVT